VEAKELIIHSLKESREYINQAVEGLSQDEIAYIPQRDCNSIAFLLWHVTRVEDVWINKIFLKEVDIYKQEDWPGRLGTPPEDTGSWYTEEQLVAWFVPNLGVLTDYTRAVWRKTDTYVEALTPQLLDMEISVFDRRNKLVVLLAHVITEIALHAGQIAYLRGVIRGMQPLVIPPE